MKLEGFDPRGEFDPYEVVIRLKVQPPRFGPVESIKKIFGIPSLDDLLLRYEAKEARHSRPNRSSGRTFTVVFSKPLNIPQVVEALKRNEFVENASPHYIYRLASTP